MPRPHQTVRLLAVCFLSVVVGGCVSTGDSFGGDQGERRAESLSQSGRFTDAAGVYIDMAATTNGPERDRLTLLAVEQWLFAGDGRRARSELSKVPTPQSGELLWLWSSDAAALSLWEGRPDRALALLEPLSRQVLPADHRARIEALRADAYFQKGEPLRAVDLYVQRENWLDSAPAIEASRNRLWVGLQVVDVDALREASTISYDLIMQGWLSLAVLANTTGQQGIGWGNGIVRWQETYSGHPAASVLSELTLAEDRLLNYPRQIALLLPLSGNGESAGNAVKNGFLGSYFSAVGGIDNQQQIRIYDVNQSGANDAYQQAVLDGAEFIVGPLLRRRVAELAGELLLPVPILSLNYLPENMPPPPGFYQFALAPEDEAASAAKRAVSEEGLTAVALVPANDWGRRMLTSFATELEELGGTLLDAQNYEPMMQDFSFEIENLVGLSQSVQRYQRLRANIGGPLQFDPRRRQDIDFVFLGADSRAGRLIKSQLKFHYSGDLPVYSTSFIYSMDGRSDSDLNDVRFADAPWVISPPTWIADYPELYEEFWPSERRLSRLHAMGYDAYHLVGALFNAPEGDIAEITGATGRLFMASDDRIHRKLAWARFERGQPVPLPEISGFQRFRNPDTIEETNAERLEPSSDD